MRRKKTNRLVTEIVRLRAKGTPWPDIAQRVSKLAGEKVGEAACRKWHRETLQGASPSPTSAGDSVDGGTLEEPAHIPPTPLEEPVDDGPMSPDEFARHIAGEMRGHRRDAKRYASTGDHISAQRSSKLAASYAAMLSKHQARDDGDGETVKVRLSEMQAAGERVRSKVHDLMARLAAERSR